MPPRDGRGALIHPELLDRPERRIDGDAKTTGGATYTADVDVPGTLEAAFVRSPYPHARIASVETGRARALAGVRAILAGADVRGQRLGRRLQDWPVLCWDRVLFIGDRVAAVAADTREIAEEAVRLISVEYDELPPLLDMDAALRADAVVLHPDAASYRFLEGRGERPPVPHPNHQGHVVETHGDVEAAFPRAARIFDHEFTTPRIHQAPLEPRAAIVWLEGDRVRVVSTNKPPFNLRDQMAATLALPKDRIVVDNGTIGGDFGAKGLSTDEFVLYHLATATGRPVRAITRYADELTTTNPRHASRIRLRTGVDADGRIVAHESHALFDGGAYAAGKPTARLLVEGGVSTLEGYRVPAARHEAATVYTNNVPGGHMRAPGQPQNVFASESHLDLIARELGITPPEMRRRNVAHAAARALKDKLGGRSVADAARALRAEQTIEVSATFDATAADHGACAHAIEVAVDVETGTVRVLAAVLTVDVGQIINPVALRGQLEGGFVYGLGMALTEDLALEEGRVRAANLGDYKLPTIADVPPLRIVHLSDGHGAGPYGARSAGELVNPGLPAAIANAVPEACGARVHTLPVTSERVWRALPGRAEPAG